VALSFNFGDLPEISTLAAVHPDPVAYWAWIQTVTNNADLVELAQHFEAAWIANGKTPIGEASRLADAVQELQAVEQNLTLVKREETGAGQITEAQVQLVVASV
jgi:hypothetical protein